MPARAHACCSTGWTAIDENLGAGLTRVSGFRRGPTAVKSRSSGLDFATSRGTNL